MTPQAFVERFTAYGPLVLVMAVVALSATAVAFWMSRKSPVALRIRYRVLLGNSLLVVGLFTLLRASGGGQAVNWSLGAGFNRLEFAANIGLYVPSGFLLAKSLVRRRVRGLVLLAIVLPAAVELLQYYMALGRISDVNDLAANGTGAVLGFLLAGAVRVRQDQHDGERAEQSTLVARR